jgi:hypothetical protein
MHVAAPSRCVHDAPARASVTIGQPERAQVGIGADVGAIGLDSELLAKEASVVAVLFSTEAERRRAFAARAGIQLPEPAA